MGEGTHRQTGYSLIMTVSLKQGYKLEGRGKNWGLEQIWGRDTQDKSEDILLGLLRSCTDLKQGIQQ